MFESITLLFNFYLAHSYFVPFSSFSKDFCINWVLFLWLCFISFSLGLLARSLCFVLFFSGCFSFYAVHLYYYLLQGLLFCMHFKDLGTEPGNRHNHEVAVACNKLYLGKTHVCMEGIPWKQGSSYGRGKSERELTCLSHIN